MIKYGSIILYTIKTETDSKKIPLLLLRKEYASNFINKELYNDFSGVFMNDESIEEAISRILFEKSMNLIIEPDQMEKLIKTNKLEYIKDENNSRIIYAYKIDYEEYKNIPLFYNRIFEYLSICTKPDSMNKWTIDSCPLGFLDKSELKWVGLDEIMNHTEQFNKKLLYNLNLIFDKLKLN
jgi:hypothetical protein